MTTGSVYGRLQSLLAKLGKDDDTKQLATFINGKQHGKLSSSGKVEQSGEFTGKPGGLGKTKDTLDLSASVSNALSLVNVQPNMILPG